VGQPDSDCSIQHKFPGCVDTAGHRFDGQRTIGADFCPETGFAAGFWRGEQKIKADITQNIPNTIWDKFGLLNYFGLC
jgi:hypothetical protein